MMMLLSKSKKRQSLQSTTKAFKLNKFCGGTQIIEDNAKKFRWHMFLYVMAMA